jgi:hypothetical protein
MPVYFIQDEDKAGPIKIGWSKNVTSRLMRLNSTRPPGSRDLIVLNTIDCDRLDEFKIHNHFNDIRLHGEWFLPTERLLSFIDNPSIKVSE